MRQVEKATVFPFLAGLPASGANCHTDGHTYYLHGNSIARRVEGGALLHHAGWNTRTTASRLRAIVEAIGRELAVRIIGGRIVVESRGRRYLDDAPVFVADDPSDPNDLGDGRFQWAEHFARPLSTGDVRFGTNAGAAR